MSMTLDGPTAINAAIFASVTVSPMNWNITIMFGIEKLEWCGYLTIKKFDSMITIHKCDRRQDRWTDTMRRHRPHLYIASRCKKQVTLKTLVAVMLGH